jgi:hypothetical protein
MHPATNILLLLQNVNSFDFGFKELLALSLLQAEKLLEVLLALDRLYNPCAVSLGPLTRQTTVAFSGILLLQLFSIALAFFLGRLLFFLILTC